MNSFKEALARRERQIGLWLSLSSAYSAEACATAGFDWLLIDGEHGPNDLRSILGQLQSVQGSDVHPVVRTLCADPALVKQALDIGAQTLLIPMIDTVAQARAMVAATQYPPQGIRGVASAVARASRWGARTDYLNVANDEVCLLVQAETRTALENLQGICDVDGVHGVFIGPADLAASMGYRGRPEHPAVQKAIEQAIATIVRSGKAAGTLTADKDLARRYLDMGATFVAVGVELVVLVKAVRQLASEFERDRSR